MGAILAFDVAAQLFRRRATLPQHLFVSAALPLEYDRSDLWAAFKRTASVEDDLRIMLGRLGGTPADLPAERLKSATEALANDMALFATRTVDPRLRLPVPLTVISGADDALANPDSMGAWREYTERDCRFAVFPGAHFYLHKQEAEVTELIRETLVGAAPVDPGTG